MAELSLRDIIKSGTLLFAVGVAVAVAAPIAANLIAAAGVEVAIGHGATFGAAMWTGLVFGAFGAIHTALTPVWDNVFGTKQDTTPAKVNSSARINDVQIAADMDIEKASEFAKKIEQERAAKAMQPRSV